MAAGGFNLSMSFCDRFSACLLILSKVLFNLATAASSPTMYAMAPSFRLEETCVRRTDSMPGWDCQVDNMDLFLPSNKPTAQAATKNSVVTREAGPAEAAAAG